MTAADTPGQPTPFGLDAARPLAELDASGVVGLFTDIDDTLTTDGRMPADAYAALERLSRSGLRVVPITGRSAGWAHMALHLWPVEAVIAESGGLIVHRDARDARDARGRTIRWLYHDDPDTVRRDRERLVLLGERVLREVPGLAPASDNPFRLVDFALDYNEQVARVPDADVERAIATFRDAGFNARASTVHVNAWSGDFDKGPMALRYLEHTSDAPIAGQVAQWVFVGDAPNDVSMFERFPLSVGVANIRGFAGALSSAPAFLTTSAYSAGFVELAGHLIRARGATPRR